MCGHGHNNSSLGPCCEWLEYQASPPAHYSSQPHTFYIPLSRPLSSNYALITNVFLYNFNHLQTKECIVSSKLLLVTAPPAAVGEPLLTRMKKTGREHFYKTKASLCYKYTKTVLILMPYKSPTITQLCCPGSFMLRESR